ncbi:MAG: hypothetical protein MSIBF_03975 [Candidatus Altiarchaeales archaeon IMC4]|nr:MAG: hypothetical protein MSIBF_03975 [Candidatus Altiarchaeales archaeon IMC4]
MMQLTLVQLDNYGPWTVTPEPKKEALLQKLQADIYSKLQDMFMQKKSLLFMMRQDNMIAVTNGMAGDDHRRIIQEVNSTFPVTVSMSAASAQTAYEAQRIATEALVSQGGAKHGKRKGALKFSGTNEGIVQMAHIDVDNITHHTDNNVYASYSKVVEAQSELTKELVKKGALVFFMGGDNFISPSNGVSKEGFENIFSEISERIGVSFKAGVGTAKTSEDAVALASIALKEVRKGTKERIIFKN